MTVGRNDLYGGVMAERGELEQRAAKPGAGAIRAAVEIFPRVSEETGRQEKSRNLSEQTDENGDYPA